MADSTNKNTDGVLRISVFSDGNAISNSVFGLISVYVYKAVNKIGKATLTFEAGDMPNTNIPESEDNTFAIGKKIRIEAGYAEDENPIFEGIVITHKVVLGSNENSHLEIECRDYAYPTTLTRKNNVFAKKKDNEAIQTILGNYADLSPSLDTTNTQYNDLVQYYCSDWDFVLSRADANGLVIVTDGKDIRVKKPNLSANPKLKVTYGIDLIEFHGELSASDQLSEFKAIAWDSSTQKTISTDGKKPSLNQQGTDSIDSLSKAVGNENMILQTCICEEKSALQAWADSQRLKAGLSKILGYCKFQGNAKALHGDVIELDGFGKRFNGNAYIGYVEHEVKDGDWVTTAGLGLAFDNITERNDVVAPPASGFMPGVRGLHIGKVTKLDEDPAKANRIQIEFSILGCETKTIWARLSNFWASNNYGAFFIPDIGDEVILGFFNEDPCQPVILGSLYSSKQKPVDELTADNKIRSITTKSNMRIEFEEEKKIITIKTPGKNTVIISDEDKGIQLTDQNNNKIIMNDSGITIESAKDLTLKSKSNITIDAGAKLDAKAKSDLQLKGMNVKTNADMELSLKGNAKAELNASGQTIVKGAMVMIN
ncbi:MAG: type VI secretion system tip protein VgrG [Bacteroidales bacterium]|jgi:Rhs element Vgr protein|nr:type VI secretion system tip protein VgrG [Bacteroidales bacterium]